MAINLKKGSSINLQKEAPGLNKIAIGLGWDVNESASSSPFDLDASVFVLNDQNKLVSDEYFVFYNNLKSPDGAVCHLGDNRTGEGDGDDETIMIDLKSLNPSACQIVFAITIDEANTRGQNFGMVPNAFAHIYNAETSELFGEYLLNTGEIASADSTLIARFYKNGDSWEFEALELGYQGGLMTLIELYQ